jgi:hypothetical protein
MSEVVLEVEIMTLIIRARFQRLSAGNTVPLNKNCHSIYTYGLYFLRN